MSSQTVIWELMLVAVVLLVTFFACEARIRAPSVLLTLWRIALVAAALLATILFRGAWLVICSWSVIIIWGRILYVNERADPLVREPYEFCSFVWNWRWPDYKPTNFDP